MSREPKKAIGRREEELEERVCIDCSDVLTDLDVDVVKFLFERGEFFVHDRLALVLL